MTKTVEMETSAGTMHIELDDERAPLSAQNFLEYVRKGHYNDRVPPRNQGLRGIVWKQRCWN